MQLDHEPLYSYYRHDLQINWNYIRSREERKPSLELNNLILCNSDHANRLQCHPISGKWYRRSDLMGIRPNRRKRTNITKKVKIL